MQQNNIKLGFMIISVSLSANNLCCLQAMDSLLSSQRLARDLRTFQRDEESLRFIRCLQSESDQYTLFVNMCPLTGTYAVRLFALCLL
jgi:hypothetical protein